MDKLDFSKRIQDLTTDFVGRDWLFGEVESFLQGGERALLIEGEAGAGKSAAAARLVQRGIAQAHHFCAFREGGTLDPIAFIRSMSSQLCELKDFARCLVEQPAMQRTEVSSRVHIDEADHATVYGVYIAQFIVVTRSADEAFQVLLRNPLKSFAERDGRRVVLLVDALDEATRLDRHPNIPDLIDSARDLPPSVRWVLTSRPRGPIGAGPGVLRLSLDLEPRSLEDAATYVDATLAEPAVAAALVRAGQDAGAFRRALLERGDPHDRGNFLFLRYVLRQLREEAAAGRPLTAPSALPAGLDEVYRDFLDRALLNRPKDERRRLIRPVLGVLAAAQEPLTLPAIVDFSGVEEQDANDVLQDLKPLLDPADQVDEPTYRIFHASFGDFLCDQRRNAGDWIDVAAYHRRIADCALDLAKADWGTYALRHTAAHLARAAAIRRAGGKAAEAHDATERLVRLTLDADFAAAHERVIGDPAAHHRMVEEALRQAAEDMTEGGLPLVVEAALGLQSFRRTSLSPERAFERARAGDLTGAKRQIALFAADHDWRHACLALAAWLAAPRDRAAAEDLLARVTTAIAHDDVMGLLMHRIRGDLSGQAWERLDLPVPPQYHIEALVASLAGLRDRLGQVYEGPREVPSAPPGANPDQIAAEIRLTAHEGRELVGYAAAHPEDPRNHVRDYLHILASNSYVQYRNRFLWPLLGSVLHHPDRHWAQGMAVEVAIAALSTSRLELDEALPIALLACQAAVDPGARSRLDGLRAEVEAHAAARRAPPGDVWGSFTRRLSALGEAYQLLGEATAAASLLSLACELHYGFAGLHAPAWLCLAEAMRAAGAGAPGHALDLARRSAHYVQDPTFCARTTARFNAMDRWWLDLAAGPPIEPLVHELSTDARSPRLAARHLVGEGYEARQDGPGQRRLPGWARGAHTLRQLAELHGFPLADFERLNPGRAADEPLPDGHCVLVPDPEMAPLVAARLAAEALVDRSLTTPAARARQIQRLVPLAAAVPTALDTVLARLVLAAHPLPAPTLQRIRTAARAAERVQPSGPAPTSLAEAPVAARSDAEQEPSAWAWLE